MCGVCKLPGHTRTTCNVRIQLEIDESKKFVISLRNLLALADSKLAKEIARLPEVKDTVQGGGCHDDEQFKNTREFPMSEKN